MNQALPRILHTAVSMQLWRSQKDSLIPAYSSRQRNANQLHVSLFSVIDHAVDVTVECGAAGACFRTENIDIEVILPP